MTLLHIARDNNSSDLPTYQKGFHYEEKVKKMVYKPFGNTGICTSLLGLGGGHLKDLSEDKENEAIKTLIEAIKSGINYIDTAPYYGCGSSETIIGKALKHIPRNTYYLASKVGRYGPSVSNMFDFTSKRTEESVQESLQRLGVDYFDILQVHDLEFAPNIEIILNETLPTLQKLKEAGKTKYIGITGYPLSKLKQVLEKSTVPIDVVLSYCRCTLFDDSLMSYIPYFREKKLAIVNAASLGMGLLTHRGPPDWHAASQEIKNRCKKAADYCKDRNVDISKLAFCHALSQSKDIHVHLIGMENKNVLQLNLEALWNGLSDHENTVKEEVMKEFLSLKEKHWENVEVSNYRKALAEVSV